ncbi:MAG: alpha/beta hydrolase family protein [Candidatus Helarchaeota archaeon]
MKIWKILKILILFIFPITSLITHISINISIYYQSVEKIETITFPSPNGNIVSANLYYPRVPYSIPCPVVIYLHGLSLSKDIDVRFPLELTKKGFMVITIDQEGHGHTNGGIYNRNTLGPDFWKNVIGAIDYIYQRPDIFNTSAIGCFGHSLGGWATLMASVTDPRINASISLAGPSNLTYFKGNTEFNIQFRLMKIPYEEDILHNPELIRNLSAINYLNGTFPGIMPQNLLLIYGSADDLVVPGHGRDVFNLINDTSKCELEILEGADHGLMNTDFFYLNVRVVQYFEEKLLGITPEPRSVLEKDIVWTYVIYNHLIALFYIIYSIAIITFLVYKSKNTNLKTSSTISPQSSINSNPNNSSEQNSQNIEKINKYKVFLKIVLYILGVSLPVVIIWILLYFLLLYTVSFVFTILTGGSIFIIYAISILLIKNKISKSKLDIKKVISRELDFRKIAFGAILGILLTLIYAIISNYFKLIFIYPISYGLYIEALIMIIPIIGIELILRKVIQDELMKHNKSKRMFGNLLIRLTMCSISVMILYPFIQLVRGYYLITSISIILYIITTFTAIYIYEKTESILPGAVFETIFLAYIFANSYYLFF